MAMLLIWPAKAEFNPPPAAPVLCACCAEEGEWYERTESIGTEQLGELARVRFGPTAKPVIGPGEDYPLEESYALSQTRNGRRWQLRLRDKQGRTGVISFTIPATALSFGADLHDRPAGGNGPSLYKEWRFTGAAQITGLLNQGTRGRGPTRFRLILQGSGNNCTQAEDFKNWTLQLDMPRESFTFFGSLNNPA
jgi:hypothetical protein